MRTYRTMAAIASLALVLGGAVLAAPAALADTPTTASLVHEKDELWYKAAPGQVNSLTVDEDIVDPDPDYYGDEYYLLTFDDAYDITIDPSESEACAFPSATDHTVAQCKVGVPLGSDDSDIYDVDLGDGADTATIAPDNDAYAAIHGGSGDDTLTGPGSVVLYGEGGSDHTDGGGGVWGLGAYGGDGDDTLTGCAYECHGGPGNDELTGGADDVGEAENALYGDAGNDILHGKAGNDVLHGGADDDWLYGEEGDDEIFGEDGDDVLYGGAGQDALFGGAGHNQVYQN